MDLLPLVCDLEDRLFPSRGFDAWERSLYYHLLRRTHLKGVATAVVAIDPLARSTGMSTTKVREILRALHEKGCLAIDGRTRLGHSVRVLLPDEILGPVVACAEPGVDIESLDFFSGRRYVSELLERENGTCFYCLRKLSLPDCTLDHVVAQVHGVDNSFRNIVAACHTCNTAKQGQSAADFIRQLYRKGLLGAEDVASRLAAIDQIREGLLTPILRAGAV